MNNIKFIPEPLMPDAYKFKSFYQVMHYVPQQGTEVTVTIPGRRGVLYATKVSELDASGVITVTLDNRKR